MMIPEANPIAPDGDILFELCARASVMFSPAFGLWSGIIRVPACMYSRSESGVKRLLLRSASSYCAKHCIQPVVIRSSCCSKAAMRESRTVIKAYSCTADFRLQEWSALSEGPTGVGRICHLLVSTVSTKQRDQPCNARAPGVLLGVGSRVQDLCAGRTWPL